MINPEFKQLLDTAILLGAALGGAAIVWKYIWAPIIRTIFRTKAFFKRICDGLDKIDKIDTRVMELEKQTRVNGGASLKDDLNLIKERLNSIENLVSVQMEDDPTAVFIANLEGENSYVNRTYCRLLGVTREELQSQGWKSFILPAIWEKYDALWKDAFLHNREFSTDIFMQKADGTQVCCHIVVAPLNKIGDKNRRFLGKIKINQKCSGERCLIGDLCPHRPASRAD